MPLRLLAGSVGPERIPVRPDASLPRWHEALHVRDPRAARERLAAQLTAGADVIVAPTWLSHRRALLPVGETRQARAWTAAAVRLAREAVEIGLERRAAADAPGATDDDPVIERPRPLVAAVLPWLDGTPDEADGRLLPREAAGERDHRDQAGLLADAEPDLLLVEAPASLQTLRVALDAVSATGLPCWVALSAAGRGQAAMAAALDIIRESAVEMVFVPGADPAVIAASGLAWGGLLLQPAPQLTDLVAGWLDAGALTIALLDGATPGALAPVRAALDASERARLHAAAAEDRRWREHLRSAIAMAPGGAALWLVDDAADGGADAGDGRPQASLPDGFEWLVVERSALQSLPLARYRLIVATLISRSVVARLPELLEHGGILAVTAASPDGAPAALPASDVLRLVRLDDRTTPTLAILRREG